MDAEMLKIGEIAAVFNVSVRALRLYEKKGIITPAKTDPATGYRYYAADQIHQLNSLLELKTLGFSLSEIKAIFAGKIGKAQLLQAFSQKQSAWRDALSVAEYKIQTIGNIMERLDASEQAKEMSTLTDEQRAWLLVKMVCVEDVRGASALSEAIWL